MLFGVSIYYPMIFVSFHLVAFDLVSLFLITALILL